MADRAKKPKLIDGTVPRFLLVGVINTLVGCGAMFLLYNAAHWSYWAASAANYVLGGVVSFFLNKYFTFRRREWSWRQVAGSTNLIATGPRRLTRDEIYGILVECL